MRLWLPVALTIAAAVAVPAPRAQEPIRTRIALASSVSINGTGMRFEQFDAELLAGSPPTLPYQTDDAKYRYALDATALEWDVRCTCFTDYIVTVKNNQTGEVTRHKLRGIPSGTFDDEWVRIKLSIIDADNQGHGGEVAVPVGSAPANEKPLLEVTTERPMSDVSLGSNTVITITIRNTSRNLKVEIPDPPEVSARAPGMWRVPPSIVEPAFPLALGPQRTRELRLRVEPSISESIMMSFKSVDPDAPHTSLRIQMPYVNPALAGREMRAALDLPIRFQPNLLMLGLWLGLGVTVGSLLPLVARRGERRRMWWRSVTAALVVGVILEIIGMFLVQNKSKLVLFNFTVDPWQSAPVLLLGVIAGVLGLGGARMLEDAIRKHKEKKEADGAT